MDETMEEIPINTTVNGRSVTALVEARRMLTEFLREDLGLTGVKVSCEVQVCGACTVLLDGMPVSGCSTLAAEAHERTITTIEGLSRGEELHPIQDAFVQSSALQCGYCTPGMVLTVKALLEQNPQPTENEIRHFLEGNICRCGTYGFVMEAIRSLSEAPDGSESVLG